MDSVSQSSSSPGGPARSPVDCGWVEREVGEQGGPGGVAAGGGLDLGKVFQAGFGAVVAMAHDRFEQGAEPLDLRAPARRRTRGSRPGRRAARRGTARAPAGTAGGAASSCATGDAAPASGWARTPRAVDEPAGGGRADAVEEAQRSGPGQLVPRVVEDAQQREEVLHVGRFEEPQAAVLHVGDVAAGELELEEVGVPRGPEQHRLVAQVDALVAVGEHRVADGGGLRGLVVAGAHERAAGARAGRHQHLARRVAGRGRGHDGVGDGDDRWRRAVVDGQRDDGGARVEVGEVEDVPRRGGPEAVDGLRVVADHGEAAAARAQGVEDVGLEGVRVLVLVDEHVVEGAGHDRGRLGGAGEGPPEQEQVVEVEHVLRALAIRDRDEHVPDGVDVLPAPGRVAGHDVGEPLLRVDDPAGDGGDRVRAREPPAAGAALGGQAQIGPDEARELHRVAGVEHGERRIDADERPVAPQEPVGHGVERAAPHTLGRAARRARASRPRPGG